MTAGESGKIREGLNAFFKGAGLGGWNGTVNKDVTTVFMGMLCAAGKKTKALHWVPRPSYNPSLTWLITQLTLPNLRQLESGQYRMALLSVAYQYKTSLKLAESGSGVMGLPPCK